MPDAAQASQEENKRKKTGKKKKSGVTWVVPSSTTNPTPSETAKEHKGTKPDERFRACESECCLQFEEDDELCLLRLPPTWTTTSGEIDLPPMEGGIGVCTDARGRDFHVIGQPEGSIGQIYAIIPGQTPHPVKLSRQLTFVNSRSLDTADMMPASNETPIKAAMEPDQVAKPSAKRKRSKGEKATVEVEQPPLKQEMEEQKPKKKKKKKREKTPAAAA